MTGADREHVEIGLVQRSRMIALMIRAVEVGAASVRSSRARGAAQKVGREFLALTLAERIRCVAITFAVAAGGHGVLLAFVPTRFRPAVPTSLWIIVAVVSVAVAAAAPTLAIAWRTRRSGRQGR